MNEAGAKGGTMLRVHTARPRLRAVVVALLTSVLGIGAALAVGPRAASGATTFQNWPQLGYGPLSNYGNPYETTVGTGNVNLLRPSWTRSDPSGTPITPPIVANTRVFVTSLAGELLAFDATTGQLRWHTPLADEWSQVAAVRSPSGVVFVAEGDVGTLEAFDERTGASLWAVPTYVESSQPIWQNGQIFMRAKVTQLGADKVCQFNAVNGSRGWCAAVSGDVVAAGSGVVYVSGTNRFTALRATTGAVLWHSTPMWGVSFDGSTLFGVNGTTLYARDYATGALRWSTTQSSATFGGTTFLPGSGHVVYADTTYGGASRVHAYDSTNGHQRWSAPVGGTVRGRFSIANGVLYFTVAAGRVIALDAANGALRWSRSFDAAGTAFVVNGTLYDTTASGQIKAFTVG
jgi:outer membrane protein assembly factor BamB